MVNRKTVKEIILLFRFFSQMYCVLLYVWMFNNMSLLVTPCYSAKYIYFFPLYTTGSVVQDLINLEDSIPVEVMGFAFGDIEVTSLKLVYILFVSHAMVMGW